LLEGILCLNKGFGLKHITHIRETKIENLLNSNASNKVISITAKTNLNKTIHFENEFAVDFSTLIVEKNESNIEINFINQKKQLPDFNLLSNFDEFDEKLLKGRLIDILKIVDNRIEDIRTFKSKEGLWIKLKDSKYETIENFGDATNNIIRYFTPIFKKLLLSKSKKELTILLIDEIENGIHYAAQKEFWKILFDLCKSENVQVFATTHSLEMITAFNEVAKEEGEGAYFEIMRDENDAIKILKHSPSILEEELEIKANFRGEVFKDKIDLTPDLIATLNDAVKDAQNNLIDNNIPVPFIKDGWIWQTMPNGKEVQYKKLEPLKKIYAST